MQIRSVVFALFASSMLACTMAPAPAPLGTRAKSGAAADESDNGGKSTAAESSTTTNAAANTALDGTWDLTSDDIAPSEMTVKGGKFTGTVILSDEGVAIPDNEGCTMTKDRVLFALTVSGDKLTGTMTATAEYSSAECGDAQSKVVNLTGTRKHADANAKGATVLEGDWSISSDGEGDKPIVLNVAGLVAKAYDQENKDASVTTTLKSGVATAIQATGGSTVAARKR